MGLSDGRVGAAIAVTDMDRAVEFYEGKLGLRSDGDDPDGGRTYQCGGATTLHVFPSTPRPGLGNHGRGVDRRGRRGLGRRTDRQRGHL